MDGATETKLDALHTRLAGIALDGRFALAFSGGLDSRFVAHAAKLAGLNPLLLHAEGPHIPERESLFARQWAAENGFELRLLQSDPLAVAEVAENGKLRCYHCKRALFTMLLEEADGLTLCDGTQASDSTAYRPGMRALTELGVISPLADAGLTKAETRQIAAKTGMAHADQRARPCLLTRFAYLVQPDEAMLRSLDAAEEAIDALLQQNANYTGAAVPDFRLRLLSTDKLELHITPLEGNKDPEWPGGALLADLEDAVIAATGKQLFGVRVMASLSGFFDRE